jgi:hypothetical protein
MEAPRLGNADPSGGNPSMAKAMIGHRLTASCPNNARCKETGTDGRTATIALRDC